MKNRNSLPFKEFVLGQCSSYEQCLFLYLNGFMPNELSADKYDLQKAHNYLINKIPAHLKKYTSIITELSGDKIVPLNSIIPISKEIIISIGKTDKMYVYYSNNKQKKVLSILEQLKPFKDYGECVCNIICQHGGYFELETFNLKTTQFDIETNYGQDLARKDALIKSKLSDKNTNGIVFLHGDPGTGKTTYIRSIIHYLHHKERRAIYVPPSLVPSLSDPSFIGFMANNKKDVLIIEDAEEIVSGRDSNSNSVGVSNLLNMADGLLGEAICSQIICTFNTKISNIDPALKRKGRIICEHHFDALDIDSAQSLSDKLGFKSNIEKPMTLAEIYNQDSDDFSDKKREKIGFNSANN